MKIRTQVARYKSQGNSREASATHSCLLPLGFCLALAACATVVQPAVVEGNVLTYHHPFTDAAAQAAQQNAGKICAERKHAAIRTGSTCSLKECTTHFQCVANAAGKN